MGDDAVSDGIADALGVLLEEHDPLLDPTLELVCTECDHAFAELLDVVSYLWDEIDARARRLVQEIHLLARAYGWTESEILALGPRRRGLYLQMVT